MRSPEQRDALIFIGGASGVGKTTLATELEKQGTAVYRKFHNIALDIAREMGGDTMAAIAQMDDSIVIKKMIDLVREYNCIVTDLHFAIQPKTDTNLLAEGKVKDKTLLATEEYVPAIKAAELSTVCESDIALIAILITCDLNNLIQRRLKDTTRVPKSLDREIVQKELIAEMALYLSTISQLGLDPQIFTNEDNQLSKLKDEVANLIESKRKRKP